MVGFGASRTKDGHLANLFVSLKNLKGVTKLPQGAAQKFHVAASDVGLNGFQRGDNDFGHDVRVLKFLTRRSDVSHELLDVRNDRRTPRGHFLPVELSLDL